MQYHVHTSRLLVSLCGTLKSALSSTHCTNVCRLHNWIYKWQDAERRRIISNQRPHQLIILLDYANRYTHWQQDGECCKHDRQSSHLVVYVLSNPTYGTSAKITKTGHRCEVWTFWNEDPKQTPECIHAALRTILQYEMKRYAARGVKLTEVVIFSDRCGEQYSGRKSFRMSSCTSQASDTVDIRVSASFRWRVGLMGWKRSQVVEKY